jgi:Tfp pilus assembly protein PilP
MKLTTGILAVGLMTGGLWAQNPNVINNVQSTPTVQPTKTSDSKAAAGTSNPAPANASAKPAAGASAKPAAAAPVAGTKNPPAATAAVAKPKTAPVAAKTIAAKPVATKTVAPHPTIEAKGKSPKVAAKAATAAAAAPVKISPDGKTAAAPEAAKAPKAEEKKWATTGKRDPFFSPVVQEPSGSGCSTGKKCLEIGQINLRGVVKSENGFIAVVTNSLNKAYFLRENDPVFNGYVVRITGDTVVFQETVQDKLGKASTREVVKRIFTPAV